MSSNQHMCSMRDWYIKKGIKEFFLPLEFHQPQSGHIHPIKTLSHVCRQLERDGSNLQRCRFSLSLSQPHLRPLRSSVIVFLHKMTFSFSPDYKDFVFRKV